MINYQYIGNDSSNVVFLLSGTRLAVIAVIAAMIATATKEEAFYFLHFSW